MLCVLVRRLKQLRQKKATRKRVEVRVEAELIDKCEELGRTPHPKDFYWEVRVFDNSGLLVKTNCFGRKNVAFKATQQAAMALDVPEGRIKINRVEYA